MGKNLKEVKTKLINLGVDPETGTTMDSVVYLPDFDTVFYKLKEARDGIRDIVSGKYLDTQTKILISQDSKLKDFQSQLEKIFAEYRTHLRKNYPDEYSQLHGNVSEESTTGGGTASSAGMTTGTGEQYTTPFAFNPDKKSKGTAHKYYYKLGYKLAPVNEVDKTYGTGNLGPGPKATEKGVEDNYYVKTFGYKLVDRKKQAAASKAVDYKDLWGKTYK